MIPLTTSFMHFDWAKIAEGILMSGGGSYVLFLTGKRAQKWREKVDTRTQDQKNIDQLLGRVDTLEKKMDEASEKIENLRTEKMELQAQIIALRQDIAVLEVKKAEFESREVMFKTHIDDLRQRLDHKTAELLCVETKMKALEQKDLEEKAQTHEAKSNPA